VRDIQSRDGVTHLGQGQARQYTNASRSLKNTQIIGLIPPLRFVENKRIGQKTDRRTFK
jgi:hypothetical protein